MPKIIKKSKKKMTEHQAQGKTNVIHPDGHQEELVENVGSPQVFEGPVANVNVNAARKITDNNYGNFSVGVSLTLPCLVDAVEIEETFVQARDWVDAKLSEMIDDVGA